MKNMLDWRLWINLVPMALELALFRMGAMFSLIVFPVLLIVMLIVNGRTAKTASRLWAQQAIMASGLAISGGISTWLYYSNISNDSGTPLMGALCTAMCVSITLSATVLAVPYVVRKSCKQEDGDTLPSPSVRPENLFLTASPKPLRQTVKEVALILAGVAVVLAFVIGISHIQLEL